MKLKGRNSRRSEKLNALAKMDADIANRPIR